MTVRQIVVVGAGIAGLACALACARAGASVQVFEARSLPATTPAHLDIVPSLLRDFARLGVAEAMARRGFAYNGLAVVDERGQPRFEVPTPRLAGSRLPCAVGIALDEAMDILAAEAASAGAVLHASRRVESVEAETGCVTTAQGERLQADLIVLATGVESPLVARLFGTPLCRPEATLSWWHALLPRPEGLERSTWMVGDNGRRVLLVPVDMSRAGVAVVRADAAGDASDGAGLRALLASWGGLPRRLAALMPPDTRAAVRTASASLLPGPWYRGCAVCVGASAHALPAQFGQAAAQAVEDAVVLGELVAAGLERGPLLEAYMARRGERATRVQALVEQAARWLARPEPATDFAALSRELAGIVSLPA
jgi:2-polyprenyl-6-methoxyphenol hydroxylase-like FAD-dependent oxidoreductase